MAGQAPIILGQNPVSFLFEYCVKNKYPAPVFVDQGNGGQFRDFVCKVKLEKAGIEATGTARTKVLAKREAASKAVAQLFPAFSTNGFADANGTNGATTEEPDEALAENGKRKLPEERDFPKLDMTNPQACLISVLRDVKWPERTFNEPHCTLDGNFNIQVRVGPPTNLTKYTGKGYGPTLNDAKRSASVEVYHCLEKDYEFLALWYSIRAPDNPVYKKVKAKAEEQSAADKMANETPADRLHRELAQQPSGNVQTAFEIVEIKLYAILRHLKENPNGMLKSVGISESPHKTDTPQYVSFATVLREVGAKMPAEYEMTIDFAAASSPDEENVSSSETTVTLTVLWKEPKENTGLIRQLQFDGEGKTNDEAINSAAEKFFLFFGMQDSDYQIPGTTNGVR